MNKHQARNAVALLQKEPLYYRNFGIWWWHIKAELKRLGYDKAQLYHLGDYTDPSVAEYYAGLSTAERDYEAYTYQHAHAFEHYNTARAMTPDGETYLIHDQDAE